MRCIETITLPTFRLTFSGFNLYMRCIETVQNQEEINKAQILTYTWDVLKHSAVIDWATLNFFLTYTWDVLKPKFNTSFSPSHKILTYTWDVLKHKEQLTEALRLAGFNLYMRCIETGRLEFEAFTKAIF